MKFETLIENIEINGQIELVQEAIESMDMEKLIEEGLLDSLGRD